MRQMVMLQNLNCPNCAAKLEEAARKLPGMRTARVAFGAGTLNIEYDEGRLSEQAIRELVRQFGLEVAAILPGSTSA